ncbi:hypothetical protein [Streptomyces virginiae]|uniref:hypothetical protein n=1 Tax=Streptomyces virginiae TaxID=1961 RepID=UPI003869CC4E|nr:hypothetical protein OG253_00175 [Streptomyces virginiae]WTB27265.1 hypothetical protein OG253_40660 [Streptomyces virginiae]
MGCARGYGREALLGPLTAGLDVPRDLDLDLDFGDRALALEQLRVHPATNSRMVSLVMDILPEREAGLLVGSRRWPLLAARMQNIRASDSTHTVAQHLNRLTVYSSWKQATGTALVGRLVDATLNALTTPLTARPAPASGCGSPRWRPAPAPPPPPPPRPPGSRPRPKPPSPPTDSRPRPPRERDAGADRVFGPGRERLFQNSGQPPDLSACSTFPSPQVEDRFQGDPPRDTFGERSQ